MKKSIFLQQSGQTLVSLLFITIIGITVISAAAVLVYGNIQAASVNEQGTYAYYVAESGIEEGFLRLLRNPHYSGTLVGQPLIVGLGSAVIQVTNDTIVSTGTYNNSVKELQAKAVYNNGILTISSWKEVQ
jgi:hypothetical protein